LSRVATLDQSRPELPVFDHWLGTLHTNVRIDMPTSRVTAILFACVSSALAITRTLTAQTTTGVISYRIVSDRVVDSGGLGEIAIDPKARLLYGVATKIVSLDRGAVVDSLPVSVGHGYAFADNLGKGITRRGVVFDLHTRTVLVTGRKHSASAVAYDAATGRVALSFDSLVVLNLKNSKPIGAIPLGASTYVVSDGRGHFFVALTSDTLALVDARRLEVTNRWPLSPCRHPTAMAIDAVKRRIFVSCDNDELVAIDAVTGRVVAAMPVEWSVDQLAFDQTDHLLFAPTKRDTLVILKQDGPSSYRVVANVNVGPIHSAVAVDQVSHAVYLVHFGRGSQEPHSVSLLTLIRERPSGAAVSTASRPR
jgi:hypothetical protein